MSTFKGKVIGLTQGRQNTIRGYQVQFLNRTYPANEIASHFEISLENSLKHNLQ